MQPFPCYTHHWLQYTYFNASVSFWHRNNDCNSKWFKSSHCPLIDFKLLQRVAKSVSTSSLTKWYWISCITKDKQLTKMCCCAMHRQKNTPNHFPGEHIWTLKQNESTRHIGMGNNKTNRLSVRSALFPTSMMITSAPRSVRTSSIQCVVCWNELRSAQHPV